MPIKDDVSEETPLLKSTDSLEGIKNDINLS